MNGPHHVYAVLKGPDVSYIGVTNKPSRRRQHHKDNKWWWDDTCDLVVLWSEPDRWRAECVESLLIVALRPPLQHALEPATPAMEDSMRRAVLAASA